WIERHVRRHRVPQLAKGFNCDAERRAAQLGFVRARLIDYARQTGDRNMKSREDIESYLLNLGLPYEQLQADLWNVRPQGNENLLVTIAGPVVVFRIKVMDLPPAPREKLYETLL